MNDNGLEPAHWTGVPPQYFFQPHLQAALKILVKELKDKGSIALNDLGVPFCLLEN